MPYIGNIPAEKYASYDVQHITTSATSSYVLDKNVANENEIRVVLNNIIQQPGSSYAYTASGNTLTLSVATTSSDTLYVVFTGKAVQTVTPPPSSVGLAQFNATGSPGTNTFLRGDNSWATPSDSVSYLVKISADDTTPDFLNGKLVAGTGISLTEGSGGGDETLTIANTSTGTISAFTNGADNRVVTATSSTALNGEANLIFDGSQLTVPDGSVSAPAIANIGDTNTGLAFPYNNELHLIANGLDTLKIEGNKTTIVGTGFSGDAVTIQPKANQKSLIMQPENSQSGTNMMELGTNGGYDVTFRISNALTRNWDYMNDYSASNALYIMDRQGDNGVYIGQNNNSWSSMSDERIKHTWVNHESAEDKLNTLTKVGTYKRKLYDRKKPLDEAITDNENVETKDKLYVGLSAQEVEAILPECISVDGNGIKGIKYQDLTPLLIKAVQELSAKVKALENA